MKAWENFLLLLEGELGEPTVEQWLRSLRIIRFDAGNIYVEAKDPFHAAWFEEHVRPRTKTQLLNNNGRRVNVVLSVAGGADADKKKVARKQGKVAQAAFTLSFDELDPHCTLDKFIVTEGNNLAAQLACEVTGFDPHTGTCDIDAATTGVFNPIYICGGVGCGKTHLMMGIAHALKQEGVQALFCRAETFTEHVVSAIRAGEMSTFRKAYRNIDVLLVDDVQVFSRKGATQEELHHTFNALHTTGKQIILSSRLAPQELEDVEPRLVSRFEWGIVVPLEAMTAEAMAQILDSKAEALRFELDPKVREYLLATFTSSTHALIQALDALVLRSHMGRGTGSLSEVAARKLLSDLEVSEKRAAITPDRVVNTVAEVYGVPADDLLGKSQQRECVVPRQVAMHLCRKQLRMPYAGIGRLFSRDHSTVMSAIRQLKKKMDDSEGDGELVATVHSIDKKLQS